MKKQVNKYIQSTKSIQFKCIQIQCNQIKSTNRINSNESTNQWIHLSMFFLPARELAKKTNKQKNHPVTKAGNLASSILYASGYFTVCNGKWPIYRWFMLIYPYLTTKDSDVPYSCLKYTKLAGMYLHLIYSYIIKEVVVYYGINHSQMGDLFLFYPTFML